MSTTARTAGRTTSRNSSRCAARIIARCTAARSRSRERRATCESRGLSRDRDQRPYGVPFTYFATFELTAQLGVGEEYLRCGGPCYEPSSPLRTDLGVLYVIGF